MLRTRTCAAALALAIALAETLGAQSSSPCVDLPASYVPFASIEYVTAPIANGDRLVAGALSTPDGLRLVAGLPMPAAPNQTFCGRTQLAPGAFYPTVYVPSAEERAGDYHAFSGLLRDPENNQPFPGGIIPASRLGGVYAWRIGPSRLPSIASGGVINAIGNRTAPVASPGALISIYGSNLALRSESASPGESRRLPLILGGAEVRIGGIAAPLLYASGGQLTAQVPFEVSPGTRQVTVTTSEGTGSPMAVNVTTASPGIFTIARLPDYSIVGESNPAQPKDVLVIYANGLGAVNPAVPTGQLAPSAPISATVEAPRVTSDGESADVANSVLAPGFVGLYQVGLVLPDGIPPGRYPLVLRQSGIDSPAFDLYVGGSTPALPTGCELVTRGNRRVIFRNQVSPGLNVDFLYFTEGNRRVEATLSALINPGRCEMYGLFPFGSSDDFYLYFDLYQQPNGARRRIRLHFPANLQDPGGGEFEMPGATGRAHGLTVGPSGCRTPIERNFVEGIGWFFSVCLDSPLPVP